ncbi:MAG TPA: zinc-finger domain-containing protein [Thiobacillaceae bacterium]|nr:zinc-finger domain-containing protein [Thiobacillaceae bacterium]HNU65264.1 zinc-finger domain-containing protein [Thiobacillaceae bacterium]
MQPTTPASPARTVEITEADLPLHCPTPGESVWNSHPRVFLSLAEKGEALCPYCSTLYRLKGWNGTLHQPH